MDLESLKFHSRTIQAIDPNFKEEGMAAYTGIGVKKIFDLAGIPWEKGITIIGADQYVGYLSSGKLSGIQGDGSGFWCPVFPGENYC